MSVHYKFKSALDYDTVTFDGLHISVKDLKKAILQQKKIGKTSDFDLQVTNAQTKETYTDENVLIPKNASLIIARVPLTQQQRKQLEKEKVAAGAKPGETIEQGALGQVDISSLDLSEEEKIKTMMSQSTSDYDPSNYVKVRGGNQIGTVPASYICFKCHQHGHWIKDCPSTVDSANMGMTDTIKRSTGIPRSFMIEVEGPQVPGARMTPSGVFAVPAIDHEVYKEKKIEKPPFLTEKEKSTPTTSIPEDLICGICKDLLQDAVMIPCCGISFCDECIRNVLVDSEESECPDCNEKNVSPDTMIPNRFLRNSVNTFKNKTGYVKVKPKLIQQRPPSPPRPSLPDFVPPPDYVDTTSGKNQSGAKADSKPSPLSQGSPAIQTQPSPSQKTPIYGEISPFNENSNSSLPEGDNSRSFYPKYSSHGSNPPLSHQRQAHYGSGPYSNSRYPGPISHSGPYPRYSQPPPNFTGHFSQPYNYSTLKPVQGQNEPIHEEWNREGKDPSKGTMNQTSIKGEGDIKDSNQCSVIEQTTPKDPTVDAKEVADKEAEKAEKENIKLEKLKKAGIDIDDVSSVSSNASEEPPPPDENRRLIEGQPDPSQGPSYAIPSLFSGQHPVILPPPGSDPYPPPRPGDSFAHGPNERSGTPTVDERLEVPPVRAPYDAYRPPNYMMTGYDQHYGMPPHPMPMPYDASLMYDRGYRGMSRGPRIHRGRYAMRQPPPPGSRPLTPPRDEEEAYIAFQRMLKEKEEREKRKNEKMKSRRTTSRSRSRSAARSRRSFSGARSRSRTRSRTPPRRSRSRSKKRSRSRSRSFVMSRSRSRSYSRSPLHERNYSPKKYYSPHRSPLRFDRYESGYGQWGPDHRDYRRGRYRGRGRGRFYKSPPRGHEHQPYNRYRDENYVATPPRHYRSPSRYYDQRMSPRCSDYPRDSREREYRSYERDTESAARERNLRRRSHSNSLLRNQFDTERERDREKDRHREREADRDNEFRPRSRSRRSRSRRYSAETKLSQERCDRSKEKSLERRKDWDREKEGRHKSREPKTHENKDKRKYSRERDYERDREREKERDRDRDRDRDRERDREKKRGRTRSRSRGKSRHEKDRSRSKDKKKRSTSREKQKESEIASKKRRSGSGRRSISRVKEERQSRTPDDRHRKRSTSVAKEKEKRSSSRHREELERSTSREKNKDQNKVPSPKVGDKEDDDKKERKKDKEKKKKKKEKETDEERAARKKKKKEKKEEKKRKQEMKISEPKAKTQGHEDMEEENTEAKNGLNLSGENSNFVSSFKAVETKEETFKSTDDLSMNTSGELNQTGKGHESYGESEESKKNLKSLVEGNDLGDDNEKALAVKSDVFSDDGVLEDDNVELQIHASYESLLDEPGETQKKGILAPLPEISKWELEDGQVTDSNPKTSSSDAKSPEFPAKVTREVIKRAENAIFKKAVNAIRDAPKKIFEKEEKKDRKIVLNTEKDRAKEYTKDADGDKGKRIFLTREKDKYHHSHIEINKPKTEVKRTINSLQITIPTNNNSGGNEREFLVDEDDTKTKSSVVQRKVKNSSKSPPAGRVPVKERLGSKIEKQGRRPSPHLVRTVEKRSRNIDEEEVKPSKKEYQRPVISSTIESIDSKRSSIDEAHFVPNYDESSDEEENSKSRPSHEKEFKSNGGSGEAKKRSRSSSESSEESTKKHKKKRSKSKKKKQKRSKKHMSDSSDSSDSEREKKKHKKSKKKKKSKH